MPSQNIVSFQCVEVFEEHWLLLLVGPQHRPGLGHGKVPGRGLLLKQVVPEAVWHGKASQNLAAISSRYLQWQPEGKQRIQKHEIFLLEGFAFVAKGVQWVRKNNAVLASGSLPSLPLFSPHLHIIHETFFVLFLEFWFWKMPGDQTVHRGSMQPPFLPSQLAAAGIPTALQHRAGLLSEGSRARALAKQPSWGFTQRARCPDCGLFIGSHIKSARFSAKSHLSLGKLHLCHLFQSWFTHIKQNTCKSFPFSTSPKRLAWHF